MAGNESKATSDALMAVGSKEPENALKQDGVAAGTSSERVTDVAVGGDGAGLGGLVVGSHVKPDADNSYNRLGLVPVLRNLVNTAASGKGKPSSSGTAANVVATHFALPESAGPWDNVLPLGFHSFPMQPQGSLESDATMVSKASKASAVAHASIAPASRRNSTAGAPAVQEGGAGSGPGNSNAGPASPVETLKKAILNGQSSQLQKAIHDHPAIVNQKIGTHLGTAVHYVIRNGNGDKGTERDRRDLLEEPKLERSRESRDVRWIHIPSNNRIWIEDVFKVVYSANKHGDHSGHEEGGKGKGKARDVEAGEPSEQQPTSLKYVLNFINNQFAEFDTSSLHRQPHFQISYGNRPEISKFRIFSLVFPVIDVDMQQPVYFDPDHFPPEMATASQPDDRMDIRQRHHANKLDDLEFAYPETVNKCRTLDGYVYEFIDELDLEIRNGDQVLSRFIERVRRSDSGHEQAQPLERRQPLVGARAPPSPASRVRRRKRSSSVRTLGRPDPESFGASGSEIIKAGKLATAVTMPEANREKDVTPSQLESLNRERQMHIGGGAFSRIWQHMRKAPQGEVRSELNRLSPRKEPASNLDPLQDEDGGELLDSDLDQADDVEPETKSVRQQILTVPQIWLWAVEDTVVTAFPENWLVEGSALPQSLVNALVKRPNFSNSGKTPVESIIKDIVMAALEFEPTVATPSGDRSYLDAFAAEIAFVSSKVTKSYENFKASLGVTIKNFPVAIKEETDLLVRVDDILNEISMIKRVQQDQDHVCVSMRIIMSQNQRMSNPHIPNRNSNSSESRTTVNAQHERAMEKGLNDMRSPKSQHMIARLERLEEDASRVRKLIITLLDLRQRQATTENAISSGRQSALLFAQSKVLFVFTAATVIFAPLSWVSSLMALQIDQFSPGKDSSWYRADVFGASFGSVGGTLLLCILGWAAYDWRVRKKDRKAEQALQMAERAEGQGKVPWEAWRL